MSTHDISSYHHIIGSFLSTLSLDAFGEKEQEILVAPENITPKEGFMLLAAKQVRKLGAETIFTFLTRLHLQMRACPVKSVDGKEFIGTLDLRDICKYFVEEHRLL